MACFVSPNAGSGGGAELIHTDTIIPNYPLNYQNSTLVSNFINKVDNYTSLYFNVFERNAPSNNWCCGFIPTILFKDAVSKLQAVSTGTVYIVNNGEGYSLRIFGRNNIVYIGFSSNSGQQGQNIEIDVYGIK